VIFTAPADEPGAGRGATVIQPGWIDRSPCGTGTSARMAQLHARGELGLNQPFGHYSLIGSRFTGELVETTTVGGFDAVVPTIRGRAWVTGLASYLLDPDDPFPAGFLISSTGL
jgi:proline racemase